MQSIQQVLSKQPAEFLREMLCLILKENSFQFTNKSFLQPSGCAMGTKMAVAFANIFMGRPSHKLLGNFSATFEIFGNFLEFRQLLEFSAALGFLRFFETTFFTFWATLVSFR